MFIFIILYLFAFALIIIMQYFPKKKIISIPISLICSILISFIICYFRFDLKFLNLIYNLFEGENYVGISFYLIICLIIFALLRIKLWKKFLLTFLTLIFFYIISWINEFAFCGSGLFGDYNPKPGFEKFCEVKENIENFPVNVLPEIIPDDKTHNPPYKRAYEVCDGMTKKELKKTSVLPDIVCICDYKDDNKANNSIKSVEDCYEKAPKIFNEICSAEYCQKAYASITGYQAVNENHR